MDKQLLTPLITGVFGAVVAPVITQLFIPWITTRLGLAEKDSVDTKRKSKTRSNKRSSTTILQSGAGGVIGVLFGFLVISPLLVSSCPPYGTARVSVTSPSPDASVPRLAPVKGTACNMPNGKQLWLLVQPEGVTAYYPQVGPIIVPSDGNWNASVYVGLDGTVDIGRGFILTAVLADDQGSAAIRQYFAQSGSQFTGLSPLPPGIQLMDQVRVVRR